MSWIQTYSGGQFRPQSPRPEDVHIEDVAHALSQLCRFNGHCEPFYSVAEHSVRVSRLCSGPNALWGLLHDLGEAYVGDLPRPIKPMVRGFDDIEAGVLRVACEVFDLPWPMPDEVRRADDTLLATEARDLMRPPPASWGLSQPPLDERIVPLSCSAAKAAFLSRFRALTGTR